MRRQRRRAARRSRFGTGQAAATTTREAKPRARPSRPSRNATGGSGRSSPSRARDRPARRAAPAWRARQALLAVCQSPCSAWAGMDARIAHTTATTAVRRRLTITSRLLWLRRLPEDPRRPGGSWSAISYTPRGRWSHRPHFDTRAPAQGEPGCGSACAPGRDRIAAIASVGRFTCSSSSPYNSFDVLHGKRPPDRLGHPRLQRRGAIHQRQRFGVPALRKQIERLHLAQHHLGLLAQLGRLRRRGGLAKFVDHRRARARRRQD